MSFVGVSCTHAQHHARSRAGQGLRSWLGCPQVYCALLLLHANRWRLVLLFFAAVVVYCTPKGMPGYYARVGRCGVRLVTTKLSVGRGSSGPCCRRRGDCRGSAYGLQPGAAGFAFVAGRGSCTCRLSCVTVPGRPGPTLSAVWAHAGWAGPASALQHIWSSAEGGGAACPLTVRVPGAGCRSVAHPLAPCWAPERRGAAAGEDSGLDMSKSTMAGFVNQCKRHWVLLGPGGGGPMQTPTVGSSPRWWWHLEGHLEGHAGERGAPLCRNNNENAAREKTMRAAS